MPDIVMFKRSFKSSWIRIQKWTLRMSGMYNTYY